MKTIMCNSHKYTTSIEKKKREELDHSDLCSAKTPKSKSKSLLISLWNKFVVEKMTKCQCDIRFCWGTNSKPSTSHWYTALLNRIIKKEEIITLLTSINSWSGTVVSVAPVLQFVSWRTYNAPSPVGKATDSKLSDPSIGWKIRSSKTRKLHDYDNST